MCAECLPCRQSASKRKVEVVEDDEAGKAQQAEQQGGEGDDDDENDNDDDEEDEEGNEVRWRRNLAIINSGLDGMYSHQYDRPRSGFRSASGQYQLMSHWS